MLTRIEEERGEDRAVVLRELIRRGLSDWRKKNALTGLSDGSLTFRQAAELADVSYVEMLSLASDAGIEIGYFETDFVRDLDSRQ